MNKPAPLIDQFQRQITYLRVSLTEQCNLRCRYCLPEVGCASVGQAEKWLSDAEILTLCQLAVRLGVRKIRLTGGEPLVRSGVLNLIKQLNELRSLGLKEICLTTNGFLLPRLAEKLKQAGVDRLNISIDSLDAERFRYITRGGNLAQVLAGIAQAEAVGFENIKLNTVLLGGINDEEITDFVELTRSRQLHVRFIELMPMGEALNWREAKFISCETVLERCPELKAQGSSGVAQLYQLPDGKGTVGLIRPLSCSFCADCNRLRITADGKVKVCLHSAEECSLKGCTAEQMEEILRSALANKWQAHQLNSTGTKTSRYMSQIGG